MATYSVNGKPASVRPKTFKGDEPLPVAVWSSVMVLNETIQIKGLSLSSDVDGTISTLALRDGREIRHRVGTDGRVTPMYEGAWWPHELAAVQSVSNAVRALVLAGGVTDMTLELDAP